MLADLAVLSSRVTLPSSFASVFLNHLSALVEACELPVGDRELGFGELFVGVRVVFLEHPLPAVGVCGLPGVVSVGSAGLSHPGEGRANQQEEQTASQAETPQVDIGADVAANPAAPSNSGEVPF